ncbi:Predicted arabinose efflux permease, MFS family [Arthrobacter subterraneus]|uniref:Predicted arabinose efflux permease, MFS family n=1 Tax=Arthrobacter subterraneus TaxID=335973 RepID=A0A1G8IQ47_9MICC|nr:MFS transporter [Arthrobacter subterraneus]SDI21034.1 Predicted arabinose efflux permease, MFS family [Arthrobacter subterraneus]
MGLTQRFTTKRGYVVTGLGIGQILSFGSTFYLLAVLAEPIVTDTGWSSSLVVAGVSLGLVIAGLGSPRVGALVAGNHGRTVLIASALLLALGLAVLGLAPTLWWYLGAWVILGLGMSGGLYSAAFAVLGHTYGPAARSAITLLTLFGGFASTICWPLSALLVNEIGWRWTALAYAGAHLLVTAPLYAFTIPRRPYTPAHNEVPVRPSTEVQRSAAPHWSLIILIATISTLGMATATVISVHMFSLLAGIGIAGTAAVVMAATIGPSQVGARFVELVVARKHHPLWTLLAATLALAVSINFLGAGLLAPAILLVVYGVGIGLISIANGTVPLAMFGQDQYARIMGRIALPSLLAQATAPIVGSLLIENVGHRNTLVVLGVFALLAFMLTTLLMFLHPRTRKAGETATKQLAPTASI